MLQHYREVTITVPSVGLLVTETILVASVFWIVTHTLDWMLRGEG